VLVVDDESSNVELLKNVLYPEYKVKYANRGEKALQIIYSDEPPDIILLDVMMPGLSGHEVCRRVKANPDRSRIPIIFVTGLDSIDEENFGLGIGAVDYIKKPFSPAIVRARVSTHLALYNQTRELERMVAQRTQELVHSRGQIICRLGRAAEFKDNETGNHVLRVSQFARLVGQRIGLGESSLEILANTAPMHDIGKLGIPDRVLLKPGKLDAEEWIVMQAHTTIGAEIIGEHDDLLLSNARVVALTHHERWDGTGYPMGLGGDDIPLFGRIVAIVDVLDALLSKRTYKPAYPMEQVMIYMKEASGKHFDPELVEALCSVEAEIVKTHASLADELGSMVNVEPLPSNLV
jgi:putative two-component system response regulator